MVNMERMTPSRDQDALVQTLCEQIERAWVERRDFSLVDRLADQHPSLAATLYEFFADVIDVEAGPQADAEATAADARVKRWLDGEGFDLANAAWGAEQRTTTPLDPASSPPLDATPGGGEQALPGTAPAERTLSEADSSTRVPLGFLGFVRKATGARNAEIAARLNVTVTFLVEVSGHPKVKPRVRYEFTNRAVRAFELSRQAVEAAWNAGGTLQRAASRETAYDAPVEPYEMLVRRSGLTAEQQEYWLRLGLD